MFLFLTFQHLIFCFNFPNNFSFRRRMQSLVERMWRSNFAKIVWSYWPLTCFQKSFIVGFRLGSKYLSVFYVFLTNQSSSFYTCLYFYNTLFLRFPQQRYCSFVLQIKKLFVAFVKFPLGTTVTVFSVIYKLQTLWISPFTDMTKY